MENKATKCTYYWGFDYLRVILCISVVALHSNIFSLPNQYSTGPDSPLYYRVLLWTLFWVAVPAFIQLSLFLYAKKADINEKYFSKRLVYLIVLYIFWSIMGIFLISFGDIRVFLNDLDKFKVVLLLMGNYTIFYFLFVLIYLTIFTEFFIRLKKVTKNFWIFIVLFTLSLLSLFFGKELIFLLFNSKKFSDDIGFSNPFNYFPYIFSSVLFMEISNGKMYQEKQRSINLVLFFLFVFSAGMEWALRKYNWSFLQYGYISYGRISVVFEALWLVSVFSKITKKPPRIILLCSELSFGIFLVHTIVLNYIGKLNSILNLQLSGSWIFMIVLVFSGFITYMFRFYKGII